MDKRTGLSRRRLLGVAAAGVGAAVVGAPSRAFARTTEGGGRAPAYGVGGDDYVLTQDWNFGTSGNITNIGDLSSHFQYHDQFGTIGNGSNYGAVTVAPDSATALPGQPIEDSAHPVRQFTADSMKTYLVPLNGATTVSPGEHNAGCGSFQAKWTLPNGGSLLGKDLLWETRVRYVTPRYFWFAIWTAGNKWDGGGEMDTVEAFGYDNGGGNTNYDGRYWHSNSVGGHDNTNYDNWGNGMSQSGVDDFDASQYHTWQWAYNRDDSYQVFMDGIQVQSGTLHWTLGGGSGAEPINMSFLFDATWGHTQVGSVNHSMPASEFDGKFYEWDYSRVYLRS